MGAQQKIRDGQDAGICTRTFFFAGRDFLKLPMFDIDVLDPQD